MLSFTAEELWGFLPGEREDSVFLATHYAGLQGLADDAALGAQDWARILAVRDAALTVLEGLRKEGVIGANLDAEVDLYADDATLSVLNKLEDELRFVLITSYARVHPFTARPAESSVVDIEGGQVAVLARASGHGKCVRCWHHREDVGSHVAHPELCGRCVENVEGAGETRRFA